MLPAQKSKLSKIGLPILLQKQSRTQMRTAFSLQIALPYANTAAAISKDFAIKLESPGAAAISDFATETKGTVFAVHPKV